MQVLAAQTRLAQDLGRRPELFGIYLTELLTLFLDKGIAIQNLRITNPQVKVILFLSWLTSYGLTWFQDRWYNWIFDFPSASYWCLVSSRRLQALGERFFRNSFSFQELVVPLCLIRFHLIRWKERYFCRLAAPYTYAYRYQNSLYGCWRNPWCICEWHRVQYCHPTGVCRVGKHCEMPFHSSIYVLTSWFKILSKQRIRLTKYIMLRSSELRSLSSGQVIFLLAMHDIESLRASEGLPSSLVTYFINDTFNKSPVLSVCMEGIAEKVRLNVLNFTS